MAERKRRRLTNRMQDGCAYVQSETGKEGVGHYTTQRRLPELISFVCKVEDIMEKYGIESVEELENIFKTHHTFDTEISWAPKRTKNYELMIQIMLEDEKGRDYEVLLEKILSHTKKQLDTWKRACELACKWFKQTGFIGDQTKVDYFYQQAKKEGNDDNI